MNDTTRTNEEQHSSLQSASAHLVELAKSKQLVLLGDQVGIAQHVSFVSEVLPELYEAGIHNFAWEFICSEPKIIIKDVMTE